jgi:hypothetical protein
MLALDPLTTRGATRRVTRRKERIGKAAVVAARCHAWPE